MAYETVMVYEFVTTEAASAAMSECDSFEVWDAVRSYGSYRLTITTAARDLQRIMQVFAKYGGKRYS